MPPPLNFKNNFYAKKIVKIKSALNNKLNGTNLKNYF